MNKYTKVLWKSRFSTNATNAAYGSNQAKIHAFYRVVRPISEESQKAFDMELEQAWERRENIMQMVEKVLNNLPDAVRTPRLDKRLKVVKAHEMRTRYEIFVKHNFPEI